MKRRTVLAGVGTSGLALLPGCGIQRAIHRYRTKPIAVPHTVREGSTADWYSESVVRPIKGGFELVGALSPTERGVVGFQYTVWFYRDDQRLGHVSKTLGGDYRQMDTDEWVAVRFDFSSDETPTRYEVLARQIIP